jgi:hypothetical protein
MHKILLIFPVTHYLHQLNTKLRTHSKQLTPIVNTQITIRVASPRESLGFHVVYQEQNHRYSDNDTGGDPGFESRHWQKLFSETCRTVLGPTNVPIKWVPE